MENCLFCKIIKGEIPSAKVYEDDKLYAFKDINPLAPVHILIVPKKHIDSIHQIAEGDIDLIGYLNFKISEIADLLGVSEDGYRIVSNIGNNGGQVVHHIHYHLLGGRQMGSKLG